MRAVLAALVVTAVVVVLLVSYDTRPPTRANPESALRSPAPLRSAAATPRPHPPGSVTAKGPLVTTPFSSIQVQATMLHGKLIDIQTLSLTGADTHTQALNARAEPILREEALRAGSAEVDAVSGATYTSESWSDSLTAAIEAARVD
ncbi:MAG: FMN-binding protein [Solirubrobacteraceae bacterium]